MPTDWHAMPSDRGDYTLDIKILKHYQSILSAHMDSSNMEIWCVPHLCAGAIYDKRNRETCQSGVQSFEIIKKDFYWRYSVIVHVRWIVHVSWHWHRMQFKPEQCIADYTVSSFQVWQVDFPSRPIFWVGWAASRSCSQGQGSPKLSLVVPITTAVWSRRIDVALR
jgi:hypothetical protein